MRPTSLSAVVSGIALVVAIGLTPAHASNACAAAKIKCANKKAAGLLKCEVKNEATPGYALGDCVAKVMAKFDGGTKGPAASCFGKAETKYFGTCPTTDDLADVEAMVDDFVDDVVVSLAGDPANEACQAGKMKCVLKRTAGILKCEEKCQKDAAACDVLAACRYKASTKYDGGADPSAGCFAKLEAKGGCSTAADSAMLAAQSDTFANNLTTALDPPPACPSRITFLPAAAPTAADRGWTGLAHDTAVVPSDALVTVSVFGCSGTPGACGTCSYSGPIANPGGIGKIRNRRCTGNTGQICTSNADCAVAGGTCEFYFGAPLHLGFGGVSACLTTRFNGSVSGTVNLATGASAGTASLTSHLYSGGIISQPCPICVNDTLANDNALNGTCSGGANNGQTCDANGSSPSFATPPTSLDCPPEVLLATQSVTLAHSTGTATELLHAARPSCRATGHTTKKCFCDTCATAAAEPCSVNADCGLSVCGGTRCLGGTNAGAACTLNSACPGGACGVPGKATAPNPCWDDVCSPDGGNEGKCAGGPLEHYCAPVETWRGCFIDAECPVSGDTCAARPRDCYTDNGLIGATVSATGVASPPVNHASTPTLAALFCMPPVASASINDAWGLPGLARFELPGQATDNGRDP